MEYDLNLLVIIIALVPYTWCENYSFSKYFFKKGQKPYFSCTVNQDADYLIRNHLKYERHSYLGQPEALSRLGNVENGLEKNYSVSIHSTGNWVEFRLAFLQDLNDDFGFLQCVLYNSYHEILQIQQVGVFVTDGNHFELDTIGANDLINQERLDDSLTVKKVSESPVEIHLFLERSEMMNVPVTKAKGSPPRITKLPTPFVMNTKTPKILDVHYVAYPPATAMWYINCSSANPVRLTKHITSAATRSYLTFQSINSDYQTCNIFVRIQNMHGKTESKTSLIDSLVNVKKRSIADTQQVTFTHENDIVFGESVILTCSTNIEHGSWLIYMEIDNDMDLLCSNDILTTGYSYEKYNLTIVKWKALKIEIKKCSIADITVYTCICSDDTVGKSYEDQIDLRSFYNPDGDDSPSHDTIIAVVIISIVFVLVTCVTIAVCKTWTKIRGCLCK